jgi:hypothetical protein
MWDFVMDKSGAGAGFLRELRFPLPIYIPSASPQSSSLSPDSVVVETLVMKRWEFRDHRNGCHLVNKVAAP